MVNCWHHCEIIDYERVILEKDEIAIRDYNITQQKLDKYVIKNKPRLKKLFYCPTYLKLFNINFI